MSDTTSATVLSPNGRLTTGVTGTSIPQPGSAPLLNATTPASIPDPPSAPENIQDSAGRRVRLRAKPAAVSQIYGQSNTGLLAPLKSTNGMVFPYQPVISQSQEVSYSTTELVHANQDIMAYTRTPSAKITVDGKFTVQTQEEGMYSLACIHFLRTVCKMWFGGTTNESIAAQGTPPPILLFDAYGSFMFNALPVIVTNFNINYPDDVDYVPIQVDITTASAVAANSEYSKIARITLDNLESSNYSNIVWLPALFSISISLVVQNSPQRLRAFDLDKFRNGDLLRQGGWI